MSTITSDILAKIAPGTPRKLRDRFIPYYNECLPRYGITSKDRVAAFLTTVCFESDYFKALAEYASGWDYDITHNRKKALELGNTKPGDGPKYKGAGGIETTGKKNYQRLSDRLGIDFVANPNLLRTEQYFVEAACVFWDDNHFNHLADDDEITLIENITNRGSGKKTAKALADRIKIYNNVMAILPDDFSLSAVAQEIDGDSIPPAIETPSQDPASKPLDATSQPPIIDTTGQAVESQASTNILTKVDALGDKVQSVQSTAQKFQLPTLPTGLGTKLSVIWKQIIMPAIMGGIGWLTGHWWECLIVAGALIALGTYEYMDSRRRNNPVGAVPPEMMKSTVDAVTPIAD